MNPELLASLVADIGSVGFIVWIAHRLTTHTVPTLARENREALERQRADFRAALADQRRDLLDALDKNTKAVNDVAQEVRELTIVVRNHDAWERATKEPE